MSRHRSKNKRRDGRFRAGRHWHCANQGCRNMMFVPEGANPNRAGGWNCWKCGGDGLAMSEQLALLKAILREPDEDMPRRAYADYLRESGVDPDRGEYIHCAIYVH